jgi:hypothetical protein
MLAERRVFTQTSFVLTPSFVRSFVRTLKGPDEEGDRALDRVYPRETRPARVCWLRTNPGGCCSFIHSSGWIGLEFDFETYRGVWTVSDCVRRRLD